MSNIGLKTRNQNERDVIEIMTRCHNWVADKLNIDSKMEFGRTAYWGKDAFHAGLWFNTTKQSVLNFRNLYGAPMARLLRIIAHEARHAVQYRDGLLLTQGRNSKMTHNGKYEYGTWKGERYSGSYRDAPWEIDARAHEKQYSDMIIKAGIISPAELKMKLSGKQDQVVYLGSETRNEIRKQHVEVHFYKASKIIESQQEKRQKQLHKAVISAGFKYDVKTNRYSFTGKTQHQAQDKAWKKAKKDFNTKYCDKSIAFLTRDKEKLLSKGKRFWEAQKNRMFYKSRPMQDSDLVY